MTAIDRATYLRGYRARTRARLIAGHEECMTPSCCAQGLLNYAKGYMRDRRDQVRNTVKPGHQDCQRQSCCFDGLRNTFARWHRNKLAKRNPIEPLNSATSRDLNP